MTPQNYGTSDAAGLLITALLVQPAEVNGTGTTSSPNGAVQHTMRFTIQQLNGYWDWPATDRSNDTPCFTGANGTGSQLSFGELSQSSSTAVSCWNSYYNQAWGPAYGVIFRLKASVYSSLPACFATSPQAKIIATGLAQYGMISADGGADGGLIGTPDTLWNDADLACLKQLTLANFEPVNVSSLQAVSNNSFATTPAGGVSSTLGAVTLSGAPTVH
jgi:hypothetical protein